MSGLTPPIRRENKREITDSNRLDPVADRRGRTTFHPVERGAGRLPCPCADGGCGRSRIRPIGPHDGGIYVHRGHVGSGGVADRLLAAASREVTAVDHDTASRHGGGNSCRRSRCDCRPRRVVRLPLATSSHERGRHCLACSHATRSTDICRCRCRHRQLAMAPSESLTDNTCQRSPASRGRPKGTR